MKINIAASHRFHLLDLARELEKLGHEVCFYSYIPAKRSLTFGLNKKTSYSFFYLMIPFLILVKITKGASWTTMLKNLVLDFLVSVFMKPCDIFIGLGSVYKKSFLKAKKKYDAITILEWGSKHIIEQRAQFKEIAKKRYSASSLKRDLIGYDIVDYISIPAKHVVDSFIKHGISEKKLLVNPYGVDLTSFYPTKLTEKSYDIIMVGGWRFEKGADLIIEFCKNNPKISFLHVGAIANTEFPKLTNMTHIDTVDQNELVKYYAQARVFALPSRSEGLAMVQAQAIACGLPIIYSMHTGGSDLKQLLSNNDFLIEMREYTPDELGRCIHEAIEKSRTQLGIRNYAANTLKNLTWEEYGIRYNKHLNRIL